MKKHNFLFRMIFVLSVFMLGINSSYADIVSGIEGESMPDAIVRTAESPYLIEPPADAIVIDFDDLIPAPQFFAEAGAAALRDRYAAQGVSFEGPDVKDGGAILDELSGFFVVGHSSPNFLAFDNLLGFFPLGGIAQGPETMYFDPSVNQVQANVGSGLESTGTITMDAYDASDQLVDSDTVDYNFELQTISVQAPGITRVIVSFTERTLVLDDLAFVQEGWRKAYDALLDSTSDLDTLRAYRDEILSQKARGRLYKKLLYNNSEDALEVLLDNPELISQARYLIETNKDAVFDVLNGKKGVIHNTDEIIAFLKAFSKKSPPRLKALAKLVKRGMLRKKRKGKLFLGFRLK
jgi:hypothetical protein